MWDLRAQRQRSRLPSEVTGFIGRKAELSRIAAQLDSSRLVTVLGPGGVGKTRLALRVAAQVKDRYPDGPCLVDLSGLPAPGRLASDLQAPGRLAAVVADCLGLPELEASSLPDAVLSYLRDQRLLLILDTCEHLIDACAAFAERVLREAPGVTMLATSRQPLDVPGEHTFLLPPLPLPAGTETTGGADAMELFAQRAAAAVPGFRVTAANRADVVRLCQRLDGIPLAIELAAVRLRALPLPELTQRLENRFQVLTSGRRGAVARHQTLHSAIEWSHELCSPTEQELWARLSVFADGFDMNAVLEVCADPGEPREDTITTLISLVDKSIVLREPAERGRYRMLDTLREFGGRQFTASDRDTEVQGRLLARCLRMARRFDAGCLDDDQVARFRELRDEHANICAALTFSLELHAGRHDRDGAALATALDVYWVISGQLAEGGRWLEKVLDRFSGPSPQRAWALAVRGRLATYQGDIPAALADIRASLQLATELGDRPLVASCHMYLNLALACAGWHEEAAQAGEEATRMMEAASYDTGLLRIQPQLAHLSQLAGDLDRSVEQCAAGLRMLGAHKAERWLHGCLHLVAGLALFQQPSKQAECVAEVRQALQAKHELGDLVGTAYALEALAWLAAREGRPERTAWLLGAAAPLWKRTGSRLSSTAILEEFHQVAERAAQEALGERRYATLAAAGGRRPLALVIGHALADADELRGHEPVGDLGAETATTGGGLTSREHEIAVLVASGLSNREIAGRLVISKRTVDAHVEHIFSKLGISSRVQLTVWLRDRLADGRAEREPVSRSAAAQIRRINLADKHGVTPVEHSSLD
jgi:non-specific serine/threonine protein kinase